MLRRRGPLPGTSGGADEVTYVSLGEGACSEGEFWESLNAAMMLHLPLLYVVADNGWAISVPAVRAGRGTGQRARGRLPGPRGAHRRRHRLLRGAAGGGGGGRRDPRRRRPGPAPRRRSRGPTRHSAADTQSKYRARPTSLADEARRDPVAPPRSRARRRRAPHRGRRRGRCGRTSTERWPSRGRRGARRTEARSGLRHRPGLRAARPRSGPEAPAADGHRRRARPVAMGEAIRRTLHEQMAADERIRVFGEDVADAREACCADVEGKGGVFGTTHGLQRDLRPGPLLQHAARRRPTSSAGPSGRRCGACGPAPRSSSSTTSGRP